MNEQRLAQLEFHYLALLDGHRGSPKTLHRMLGQDPQNFAALLGVTFKKKGRSQRAPPNKIGR